MKVMDAQQHSNLVLIGLRINKGWRVQAASSVPDLVAPVAVELVGLSAGNHDMHCWPRGR